MIKTINGVTYYPFSGAKNQHKLYNAYDRAILLMDDMNDGEIPYNEAEYDKASDLVEKLDKLLPKISGGICYLNGKDVALAKELSMVYDIRGDMNGNWRNV